MKKRIASLLYTVSAYKRMLYFQVTGEAYIIVKLLKTKQNNLGSIKRETTP